MMLASAKPAAVAKAAKRTRRVAATPKGEGEEASMETTTEKKAEKSAAEMYNATMRAAMANPYEYQPDIGLYYTEIATGMLVGTQLRSVDDVDRLVDVEGMTAVVNMQQDKDIKYWDVDLPPILARCAERGVQYLRVPAVDFSGDSLRRVLPKAAATLEYAHSSSIGAAAGDGNGDLPPATCYCHCTAGLGRSPGAVIGWLYWFSDFRRLDDAYDFLTFKRPCGPKKEAIRAATWDLLGRPGLDHSAQSSENPDDDPEPPPNACMELTEEEKQRIRSAIFEMFPYETIMKGQPPRPWNGSSAGSRR